MTFTRRVGAFCAVLATVALPAYANNPPRPDGVLYLILVFPLIAVASHLAGVVCERPGWAGRIGRGLFFTFVILASAAGTELGLLAMLVIVVYGLARSVRIARRGEGARRWAYATVTVIGTLLAGAGYVWALSSMSGSALARGRQKRTMADMRTVGIAIMSWSMDQQDAEPDQPAPESATEAESAPLSEVGGPGPEPESGAQEISFAEGQGPPPISHAELSELLVPDYLRDVPVNDGWHQPLDYRFNPENHHFQVRSGGGDREFDSDRYTTGTFDRLDYDRDIVYADGAFIRWPQSVDR